MSQIDSPQKTSTLCHVSQLKQQNVKSAVDISALTGCQTHICPSISLSMASFERFALNFVSALRGRQTSFFFQFVYWFLKKGKF